MPVSTGYSVWRSQRCAANRRCRWRSRNRCADGGGHSAGVRIALLIAGLVLLVTAIATFMGVQVQKGRDKSVRVLS